MKPVEVLCTSRSFKGNKETIMENVTSVVVVVRNRSYLQGLYTEVRAALSALQHHFAGV